MKSSNNFFIDIQNNYPKEIPVTNLEITNWCQYTLEQHLENAEMSIVFVTNDVIKNLNSQYRDNDKTTNVLAFSEELPPGVSLEKKLLGDVIIAPQVLADESSKQNIDIRAHFAHIIIHGVLHLLGYDHVKEDDYQHMKSAEIKILSYFDFNDPYLI